MNFANLVSFALQTKKLFWYFENLLLYASRSYLFFCLSHLRIISKISFDCCQSPARCVTSFESCAIEYGGNSTLLALALSLSLAYTHMLCYSTFCLSPRGGQVGSRGGCKEQLLEWLAVSASVHVPCHARCHI